MSLSIVLSLYVAGNSTRSERAIHNVEQIRLEWAESDLVVTVIDVLEDPAAAERARVIATPTLVREKPVPERRIIGDLSDVQAVLQVLNLGSFEKGKNRGLRK